MLVLRVTRGLTEEAGGPERSCSHGSPPGLPPTRAPAVPPGAPLPGLPPPTWEHLQPPTHPPRELRQPLPRPVGAGEGYRRKVGYPLASLLGVYHGPAPCAQTPQQPATHRAGTPAPPPNGARRAQTSSAPSTAPGNGQHPRGTKSPEGP